MSDPALTCHQPDQERDQRTVRSEELRYGSPLQNQYREEEQVQPQDAVVEAIREDDEYQEPEQRGEKQQH